MKVYILTGIIVSILLALPEASIPAVVILIGYIFWRDNYSKNSSIQSSEYSILDIQNERPKPNSFEYFDYIQYLKSKDWKKIKWIRFELDNMECQQCGIILSFEQSHCHHIHYNDLKNESNNNYESIVTVCKDCHKKIHTYHKENNNYYPIIKETK